MTDDQNQWYSDPDRRPAPPTVPDGNAQPSNPSTSPPPGSVPPGSVPPDSPPGYGPQPYPQQQAPAGYQPYGQPAPGYAAYGPVAQTNGKATTSMVLGIVGLASIFFCYGVLGIVLGPIAFFLGRSAQKEMQPNPTGWSNPGMAKAGWIMGLIQIIIAIIAIIGIAAFIIWAVNTDDPNF